MSSLERKILLERIKENRNKLDSCKKHLFNIDIKPPYPLNFKLKCHNCNAIMDALEVNQYIRGYEATGGNPNEILPGFK
jgi:hypothetical protein